jgi:hypothetical protein
MTFRMLLFFLLVFVGLNVISLFIGCQELHAQTTREDIEKKIERAALTHGIDPALALAIATVESNLNPEAVGSLGEIGIFQLRPEFHSVVPGQVDHNIEVAVRYLADLKRRCAHYGEAFFVCFNYGTARRLKYPELFPYYRKVNAILEARNG